MASNASSHSRVSCGSESLGLTRQNAEEPRSDRSVMMTSFSKFALRCTEGDGVDQMLARNPPQVLALCLVISQSAGWYGVPERGSHFHRQDHHLHSLQVQPALHRQRRLVVQLADEPVFALEHQFAGEKHAVGEFVSRLARKFGHFVGGVGAESEFV